MSRFFSDKYKKLIPYTPGEQPKDMEYIKLNTNESPFPPSERSAEYALKEARMLHLYPDPECSRLTKKLAETLGVSPDCVLCTNGSDEILNFAFMAYCDSKTPAVFPDITYGFYSVFADINNVEYETVPLKDNFTIDISDYFDKNATIFIANPNAPTGIALSLEEIEEILKHNKNNIVVIDEAYVDFGNQSAVSLIHKYDNLLVTQTFSKSRSLAGGRLGFGVGCRELIQDLNTIKYSTNPYNINRMTMASALGMLEDEKYTRDNCKKIIENREYAAGELGKLGFEMTNSTANFIFAKHNRMDGEELYKMLKEKGILIRHFNTERIKDYNRITIGTKEQMEKLIDTVREILEVSYERD
ncbi:MAG: histidinol-phosphate transaminase [Clostridia bacterium]